MRTALDTIVKRPLKKGDTQPVILIANIAISTGIVFAAFFFATVVDSTGTEFFAHNAFFICIGILVFSVSTAEIDGLSDDIENRLQQDYQIAFFALLSITAFLSSFVATNSADSKLGWLINVRGVLVLAFFAYCCGARDIYIGYTNNPIRRRREYLSQKTNIPRLELRQLGQEFASSSSRLGELSVFQANAPEIIQAWDAKSRSTIEALLKDGDIKTRESWEAATAIINEAGDRIDLARGNLSRLVVLSEQYLKDYKIDYSGIDIQRSPILALDIKPVVTKKSLPFKPNFVGGATIVGRQAMQGNMSWQVALGVMAISLVAGHVQEQRALRKLKELEGVLKLQAETAAGDISLMQTLVKTRMAPQFEALSTLSFKIDALITGVACARDTAGNQIPKVAFELAAAMLEAKYVLKMLAGD